MPLHNGATNEILQFGHGAGANVMPQAEYTADVVRTAGNQSGLARSKFVNKVWRQSTHIAAGVAQWIANRYAPGVRDNGELDAVEAGMTAAVQACASTSWPLMVVTWDGAANYMRQTLVIGSNGKIYVWLRASGPGVSGVGAKDPVNAANAAFWLDYAASTAPKYDVSMTLDYFLCWYPWKGIHPSAKPGMVPVNGTLLANAATLYPKAWAYLQTPEGQQLCTTESAWQAAHSTFWATLADGTKVGWDGIGGICKYVVDTNAGTIRVPDLRGMYDEVAGFDTLGVGGVHGDGIRPILGTALPRTVELSTSGAFTNVWGSPYGLSTNSSGGQQLIMDVSRVVPVAAKNQPRAWGALACVYLGQPAS